jgi:hypothetical protein
MKFRKKPCVIDAEKVHPLILQARNNWKMLPGWVRISYELGNIVFGSSALHIRTLEGVMIADKNDWLIQGVKGEIYSCKPDIFEATYEPVEG